MSETPPSSRSDAFVFFGASGDLAYKKIFPALYAMERRGHLDLPVIGVARSEWRLEEFRARARESVQKHADKVDDAVLVRLLERLRYVLGDYADPATFKTLRAGLGQAEHPANYLAVPPSMFGKVVEGLGASGCAKGGRLIVEKPFGRDLGSARALHQAIHAVFAESDVFRIDHYLGKEPV